MKKSKCLLWGRWVVLLFLLLVSCNRPAASTESGSPTGGGAAAGSGVSEDVTVVTPAAPTNTDGAETILIPGARFWMGSDSADAQADADEFPRHQVALSGFYIYTHEVTNEMYARCVTAGACLPIQVLESGPTARYDDPAYADHPVVGVDWFMARDYCAWAGGRLPTEAEWELAARGTESLRYPWGSDDPACDRVNMLGCRAPADTVSVGSYALGNSPYGVWDMAGNVWEWVNDWYDPDYYALSPASNPMGPYMPEDLNVPLKAVRGGGLYSEPIQLRTAARASANPHRAYDDVGFRCVASNEALPEMYTPTEYHERVPSDSRDGGWRLDEPDGSPWTRFGPVSVSCPDDAGIIRLFVGADSSEGMSAGVVEVNGVPFRCSYDAGLRGFRCEGPVPPDYDRLTFYEIMLYTAPGSTFGVAVLPVPRDCPTGSFPPSAFVSVSCPGADGLVSATLRFVPPIVWDTTQYLEGMSYVDMACTMTAPDSLQCTLPPRAPGETYTFQLHGFGADGAEYYYWTIGGVPVDCPLRNRERRVGAGCGETSPVVEVMYTPSSDHLSSVSLAGASLPCIGMAPGVQICGPLTGAAGSIVTVTTCFEGESCIDWPLTVPTCPGAPRLRYILETVCYPPGGDQSASLHYWPFDQPLVSATCAGMPMTCENWSGGWYMCMGVVGSPPSVMTFEATLADGTVINDALTSIDCSVGRPSEGTTGWRVASVGCHDESRIYVIIDTGYEWLTPTASFTYSATDGERSYSCSVHPTIPGRLYCVGNRPSAPGPLNVTIQQTGAASPTSASYADWPTWVATYIPSCGTEPPPEPEIPPPPVDPCAGYDHLACDLNKATCTWDNALNRCVSR